MAVTNVFNRSALPAPIPAALRALLAEQSLAKLVYLLQEIGGCDPSPNGRALENALSYAIEVKSESEATEDEVYDLLAEARAAQGGNVIVASRKIDISGVA